MTPGRIRAIRLRLGWTQREMAEALGVHVMTVWKWEHGRIKPWGPAVKMLDQLAASQS